MRLTLRTLLAWRDGLLTGTEQEELSAKVTDGSVAKGLLDRMQAVESRTDIEVPKVEGRGLAADANTVAEYLENVLPSDRLEAFERICLESDRHLAEVSECHGMLAEAPANRGDRGASDETLVAAVAERLAGGLVEPSTTDAVPDGIRRQPAAPRSRRGEEELPPQIRLAEESVAESSAPASRRAASKGSPWLQMTLAVCLLLMVGGGLGVVLWWNPGVVDNRDAGAGAVPPQDGRVAAAPQPATVEDASDAAALSEEPVDADAGEPEGLPLAEQSAAEGDATAEADADSGPPVARIESADDVGDSTNVGDGMVAVAAEPPLGVGPTVPMGDALAIAAPLAPAPPAAVPPEPAASPAAPLATAGQPDGPGDPGVAAVSQAGVVNRGPLLLINEPADPGVWRGGFQGDPLSAGMQLLTPPASSPELKLGGVVVQLAPRSQLMLRPREDGEDGVDLEVVFGRAVLRRLSGEAVVTLRAGRLQWQLTGPPAAVGVDVVLQRSPGGEPGVASILTASMTAFEGDVTWQPLANAVSPAGMPSGGMLAAGTQAAWSSATGETLVTPAAEIAWDALATPDRLSASALEVLTEAVRRQDDAGEAARSLASARRVELREIAAGTLALIGDYSAAVALLCADQSGDRLGERRWRAFEAEIVPLALARGENSAERLRQAFEAKMPPDEGGRVFRMAVGFSDAQLAAGADTDLVAALADPQLVSRRYAALRLEEIVEPMTRDRLRYRADGADSVRAEGMRWWAAQLEKGLIQRVKAGQLSGPDAG